MRARCHRHCPSRFGGTTEMAPSQLHLCVVRNIILIVGPMVFPWFMLFYYYLINLSIAI